jgi:flavorubredoxin
MNMWLAAAPDSAVAHGALGCAISLNDLCDRPPRALDEGEVIDLGGNRVRQISTPHVPHGWEAQVLFEENTATLLCGDLFSQIGSGAHHPRPRGAGHDRRGHVPRHEPRAPHSWDLAGRSAS